MRKAQRAQQSFRNGSHNRKLKDHKRDLSKPIHDVPKPWEAMACLA